MSKKKVAIVGTNGIPAKYGGFETLTHYLTQELSEEFNFIVYCSTLYKKEERRKYFQGIRLIYLPFKANGFQSIFYDVFSTIHALFKYDVIVVLGPAAGFILPLNKLFGRKILTNHGGLDEWQRLKLSYFQRKYVYWSHKIAAKFSDFNIADNLPLKNSLYKSFSVDSEVIEYGGDHVEITKSKDQLLDKYSFLSLDYNLCIARAQVDNNLHLLIDAFANTPNENLVIVSNWNVSKYGADLFQYFSNKYPNIFLVPAVYDKSELDVIRSNTKLYIHSHSQCGTAPSLVEAMNYNIPVICFDVETNKETTKHKSYYFQDALSLVSLIKNLDDKKLASLKEDMFKIAQNNYTWEKIAEKYKKLIS